MNVVKIEPELIPFPNTYISAISRFTITVTNLTKDKITLEWRKYSNQNDENAAIQNCDTSDPEQRRKYKDLLYYKSKVFKFESDVIEVWPERTKQVTIDFVPQIAKTYQENFFAYIGDGYGRVPLTVRGTGLPPNASFSVDSVNVGQVSLDNVLEYEIALMNTGQVGVDFVLDDIGDRGKMFSFEPAKGHIEIGGSVPIKLKLSAYRVGSFTEEFTFRVQGATHAHPVLTVYGRVVGPTFQMSLKSIHFQTVSYGFLYSQTFDIENKSDIPFDFSLELQHDGSFARREFSIKPSSGLIPKFGKQKILLEFIPLSLQDYNLKMFLNIDRFGDHLVSIPITATCICPDVYIKDSVLELGEIYIGYTYKNNISICDDTDYPAKYEFVQERNDSLVATTVVQRLNAVISPKSVSKLHFTFTPHQLGPFKVTQFIRVLGSETPLIPFVIKGCVIGPTITLSQTSINFGTIQVLKQTTQNIKITNSSLIDANFVATLESDLNVFSASTYSGHINPGKSADIAVSVTLDDPSRAMGKLILAFDNLAPISVDLTANGVGTPVNSSIDMKSINYDFVFTEGNIIKTFKLTNFGRKQQDIRFTVGKPKLDDSDAVFEFKISPDNVVIPPHEEVEFEMVMSCNKPTAFAFNLTAHTTRNKQRVELFNSAVRGTFIKPSISFSSTKIEFKHKHDPIVEEELLTISNDNVPAKSLLTDVSKSLSITNNCKLPLTALLYCPEPFSLSESSFVLSPAEKRKIVVKFDPSFKLDFSTESIQRKIVVSFKEHPTTHSVTLIGTVVFPNLEFIPSGAIDFGSLMLNTEHAKEIIMKNNGEIPVDLVWELLPNANENDPTLSKIFDIYPIKTHIDPGKSDKACVSFFALADENGQSTRYSGTAVCHITGGPDYTIAIVGGSSNIQYFLDPNHIDFGNVMYSDTLTSTLTLQNRSDVAVNFKESVLKGCKFNTLVVSPKEGVINPGQTIQLNLSVTTGLPMKYREFFNVHIGHFDEYKIDVYASSYIPLMYINLPRAEDDPIRSLISSKCLSSTTSSAAGATDCTSEQKLDDISEQNLIEYSNELAISYLKQKMQSGNMKRKRRRDAPNSGIFNGLILSRFVIDVGDIILGVEEVYKIKCKNIIPNPISFDIRQNSITDTGFFIQNSTFQNVPAGEEFELELEFSTSKRTTDCLGSVSYDILVVMNVDFAYVISIKANISMPSLVFSKSHFDFGNVIVGQTMIVTLQVQNMNSVPCEFKLGDAQCLNVLQRNLAHHNPAPFTASPTFGVLPPTSFMNIEIAFSPKSDKNFSMQFPVEIKHNSTPSFVTLKGTGVQLRVEFDPKELVIPPLSPFAESTSMDVKLINPTDYPIEVMAQQFDLQLFLDSFDSNHSLDHGSHSSEEITFSSNNLAAKLSLCIIVNGITHSGRSTVAQAISKSFGIPIINLRELWKDLIERQETQLAEYSLAISNFVSQSGCTEGFVIDGLDALPEPSETDPFLANCAKTKNALEEVVKNPFNVYPHQFQTAYEQALNYVLSSLDGHYVFMINLRSNFDNIKQRIERRNEEEERQKMLEQLNEKNYLFNMSEEQYENLSPEEKEEVDSKRESLRKVMLEASLVNVETNAADGPKNSKGRKGKDDKKGNDSDDKKRRKDEQAKGKKNSLMHDPVYIQFLTFHFTLGSLVQRLRDGGDQFLSVDPVLLMEKSSSASTMCSTESMQTSIDDQKLKTVAPKSAEHTVLGDEVEDTDPANTCHNMNSIVIDVTDSVFSVNKAAIMFIPTIRILKNKAFAQMIPPPKLILPDPKSLKKSLLPMPSNFCIEVPENTFGDDANSIKDYIDSRSGANKAGRKSKLKERPSIVLPENLDITNRTPRWVIEPKSDKSVTILFDATSIGNYKDNIIFTLTNGKCDACRLRVSGSCLYPDIDRDLKTIFANRVQKLESKVVSAYVLETNEFHFGDVLIAKDKLTKNQALYKGHLHLVNISPFPVEISALMHDVTGKGGWTVDSSTATIQPDSFIDFGFGFHPMTTDVYQGRLEISVKDNPDPLSFSVVGEGCIPLLELSSNQYDFEKLLLEQTKTLKIELKNPGKLPTYWRLKGHQAVSDNIAFNATEGIVDSMQSFALTAKYSSNKAIQLKKQIQLEVLDTGKSKIFNTSNIMILAESFDVSIDFKFPPNMDHLQFGSVRCLQPKTLSCVIVNKGKYQVEFILSFANTNLSNVFQVSPMQAIVMPSNKQTTINFTLTANKIAKYNNHKFMNLKLVDTTTKTTTMTLPITFSAQTIFSTYKIDPHKQLIFPPTQCFLTSTKKIDIVNTGAFSFEYEVISSEDLDKSQSGGKSKLPQKAKAAPTKAKKGKHGDKSLAVGSFFITPSSGTVQPGQTFPVEVEFAPQNAGHSKVSCIFKVSDTDPMNNSGHTMILTGSSYTPALSVKNYEHIFPDLSLCLSYERSKLKTNAYIEDENCLYFSPLVLSQTSSVKVNLINQQPIPIEVDLLVKPTEKQTTTFPFDVSEKLVKVLPNETVPFNITFCPTTQEKFFASFEANVRQSNHPEGKSLKFSIEGSGALPSIIPVGFEKNLKTGTYPINLGRTLVGCQRDKDLFIKNDGLIAAKFSITAKPCPDFHLVGIESTNDITIDPGRTFVIHCAFSPEKVRKSQFEITVNILDNTKSNFTFVITGEGFSDEIIFSGLVNEDELHIKDNIVGVQQKVTFSMQNVSIYPIRFNWSSTSEFKFSPGAGHIKPQSSKEISVFYSSDKPAKHSAVKAICQWQKIEYEAPIQQVPEWDDNLKVVKYVPMSQLYPPNPVPEQPVDEKADKSKKNKKSISSKEKKEIEQKESQPEPPQQAYDPNRLVKVTEVKPEPKHTVVQAKNKDIVIKVYAVSDNIKYTCDTTDIAFSPTMMFQSRSSECKITNTSAIRFDYVWSCNNFKSLRTDYAATRPPPFRVEPSSGFIEPGQTRVFRVRFIPEEVDDFCATLSCQIPYLTLQDPPSINVTALSRRPLCHFNARVSDYISVGRRHPDYSYNLPSDVKVLEMFSKEVGQRSTTRFEIINPTSSPYEFEWKRLEGPPQAVSSQIECDTPHGFVSSGKHYYCSFSFVPNSHKAVESLWEFTLKEHGISIPLLIVGRISPK